MVQRRSTPLGLSLAALVGAGLHAGVPRLVNLPQRTSGAGLGPSLSTPGLTTIAILAAAGALISLRFQRTGAALIGAAALTSTVLTIWEFALAAWLLPLTLLVPAVLLIAPEGPKTVDQADRRAALVTIVLGAGIVWFAALRPWRAEFNSTHPESNANALDSIASWLWVGAVGPTTATITAGGLRRGPHALSYRTDDDSSGGFVMSDVDDSGVARFFLTELGPAQRYRYTVLDLSVDGTPVPSGELGIIEGGEHEFTTHPDGPADLTIAFASCARTGSNGAVFDAIRAAQPDLFVQLGDLHYGNLVSTNPQDHINVLGRSLSTPAQSALYSSTPSAWIWDDHDFGDNDSDSSSPSRDAVSVAYRQAVPHWNVDPDPATPINQAFTMGRVRIVTCDTRSHRTTDTMLGEAQEAWLIEELRTASQTHALVIWANPAPWNVPDAPGTDQWGGFADERRRIANAIAEANITNLVMISGDWHTAAIDDGTNTAYADDGSPGFPLIHAAPLDRPGRRLGETFSHGVFSNAGQFGLIQVADNGGPSVQVTLTAHLWTGDELGSYSFTATNGLEGV